MSERITYKKGKWSSSRYQKIRPRYAHVSWNIKPGEYFMLIGGDPFEEKSRRTTDIVHRNGKVTPGFKLKYDV